MAQYKRVFNVYRRPGEHRDVQIVTDGTLARDREEIMVMIGSKVRWWKGHLMVLL